MATIALQVQSLLNAAVYNTYVISDTVTVQALKNYIYSNTSVSAAWYNLYYNGQTLANANTLSSYGIGNVQIRSDNAIANLSTREARQKAKLDLAKLDRIASGKSRTNYSLSALPTQWSGNTLVDNANSGGLIQGRPWS